MLRDHYNPKKRSRQPRKSLDMGLVPPRDDRLSEYGEEEQFVSYNKSKRIKQGSQHDSQSDEDYVSLRKPGFGSRVDPVASPPEYSLEGHMLADFISSQQQQLARAQEEEK